MDVRQKLALIPRPMVRVVPRRLRDRWRTALLARERRHAPGHGQRRSKPPPDRTVAAPKSDVPVQVEARLVAIESKLDAVLARFEGLDAGIEQLDARISSGSGGEAPSVTDDFRELLEPLEALSQRLEALMVDSEGQPSETRRAAS